MTVDVKRRDAVTGHATRNALGQHTTRPDPFWDAPRTGCPKCKGIIYLVTKTRAKKSPRKKEKKL